MSWVGLRGAVPIVFATYPLLAGIDKAEMIFNIVFFISLTSILIQGTTLSMVAKWLHVSLPEKVKPIKPTDAFLMEYPRTIMKEIKILAGNEIIGKRIVDLNFPKTAIIAMIQHDDKFVTPSGSTVIQENDTLIILSDNQQGLGKVYECLHVTPVDEQV